jgi:hypothetical protein
MNGRFNAFSILILFALVMMFAVVSSCASTRKNPYYEKRIKASRANATQLGRNRYFFSDHYQKKLVKSYKRKVRY